MRLRLTIPISFCACVCISSAHAAWAEYLEFPRDQPNVLLIVILLLGIFIVGYLTLRRAWVRLQEKVDLLSAQLDELKVSSGATAMPQASRVVQLDHAKRKVALADATIRITEVPAERVRAWSQIPERLRLTRMLAEWQDTKARAADAYSQADAALKAVEAQRLRLNEVEAKRIRAAQPRWKAVSEFSHELQHELNLRNVGAPASDLKAVWAQQSCVTVMLSNTSFIGTGECLGIKLVFHDKRIADFRLDLTYMDALGERRLLKVAVSQVACEIEPEVV